MNLNNDLKNKFDNSSDNESNDEQNFNYKNDSQKMTNTASMGASNRK